MLRWFLGDVSSQAATADELLNGSAPASLYIDRVTLAEATYVLRAKGYDHEQIAVVFDQLYAYPSVVEMGEVEQRSLQVFRQTNLDFEDCVMASWHKTAGYQVASFDKGLQNYLARL